MALMCSCGAGATPLVAVTRAGRITVANAQTGGFLQELPMDASVVAMAFNGEGTLFAACDMDKNLVIWTVGTADGKGTFASISTGEVPRRCTSIQFDSAGKVVVADKAGDVYRYDYDAAPPSSTLVAGHVSMLLSVSLLDGGTKAVTADRDDKIRISAYPAMYDIHGYCLGHREFVISAVSVPGREGLLVSASGDGTVKLWDVATCTLLDSLALCKGLINAMVAFAGGGIAASAARSGTVHTVRVTAAAEPKLERGPDVTVEGHVVSLAAVQGCLWVGCNVWDTEPEGCPIHVFHQAPGAAAAPAAAAFAPCDAATAQAATYAMWQEKGAEAGALALGALLKRKNAPGNDSYFEKKTQRINEKEAKKRKQDALAAQGQAQAQGP